MPYLLTLDEIRAQYPEFAQDLHPAELNLAKVPEKLRPLALYAGIWGIADDFDREELWDKTPAALQQHLEAVIVSLDDEFDEWLAGPEVDEPEVSDEYIAYSTLRMAPDFR